jgi:tellurite resistance protein
MSAKLRSGAHYRTIATGVFHCERCGGDRPYRHRLGRRWVHLLGLPIVPLDRTGEHLRCAVCRTCYRVELLAVPTMEQMQAALLGATTAAVLAMLGVGGSSSPAARRLAVEQIISAGSPLYDEADLSVALRYREAESSDARSPAGAIRGLRAAVETLTLQLDPHAREWFLAKVVQVGLADGTLSAAERDLIGTVAGYLGLSPAQAQDVILLTEEAAQAG